MEEQYFVIYTNEDGDVSLWAHTKEELLSLYDDWANRKIPVNVGDRNYDLNADEGVYIIKGVQVTPRVERRVIEWNID